MEYRDSPFLQAFEKYSFVFALFSAEMCFLVSVEAAREQQTFQEWSVMDVTGQLPSRSSVR